MSAKNIFESLICIFLFTNVAFCQQIEPVIEFNSYQYDGADVYYGWGQSSKGKVYLSSRLGLSTFDGKNEYLFTHNGRGKAIDNIVFDDQGVLWCNTFRGDIFFLEGDTLMRHPLSDQLSGVSRLFNLKGEVYLTHGKRLYKLGSSTKWNLEITLNNYILGCLEYRDQVYIIYEYNGTLYLHNLEQNSVEGIDFGNDIIGNIHPVFWLGKQYLYITGKRSLISLDALISGKLKVVSRYPYQSKITYVDVIDNRLIIAGYKGLAIYDAPEDTEPKRVKTEVQFSKVGKDIEGNILATTLNNGIHIFTSLHDQSFNYESVLKSEKIKCSAAHGDRYLFLGSNAGLLLRHDLKEQKIDTLRFKFRGEISTMTADVNNDLLFVYSDSLFLIDVHRMKVQEVYRLNALKVIKKVGDSFLMGSSRLLYEYTNNTGPKQAFEGYWISGIHHDKDGIVISTNKGMYRIQEKWKLKKLDFADVDMTKHLSPYVTTTSGKTFFVHNFSTLYEFKASKHAVEKVITRPEKDILAVQAINDNVYLLLENGIIIWDAKHGSMRYYDETDGLVSNKCIDIQKIDPLYYVVHEKSVSFFSVFKLDNAVKPVITYYPLQQSFQLEQGEWVSSFDNNILAFKIDVSPGIRDRGHHNLYYRIPGISDEWLRHDGTASEFKLERLPTGRYTLELKALNNDGVRSDIIRLPIRILPPFYFTWWFIILCALVGISGTFWSIRIYIQRIRRKNKVRLEKERLEKRAINAELRAIRSQMNPHFIFNVLTAIQTKVVTGKTSEAFQNIGDFAKLIRNILEKSGKENITLQEEIELMQTYANLENSRMKYPVDFQISVAKGVNSDDLVIPTLVTQPFIENAFKHAFRKDQIERVIEFVVDASSDGFYIKIRDNGIGFDSSDEELSAGSHKSFALSAMKKRLEKVSMGSLYHVQFNILRLPEGGTEVMISFNYKENDDQSVYN
jgi:two-component sensor histidine kinase